MFERFSDHARKVMALANQQAQRLEHDHIGTEHILLGLVKEGTGVAANALKTLGADLDRVRHEVEGMLTPGDQGPGSGKLAQVPAAKRVIEYAIEEARLLNHRYVGSEHLLIGLLREQEGLAARALMNLGVRLHDARLAIADLLGEAPPEPLAVPSDAHLPPLTGAGLRLQALLVSIDQQCNQLMAGPEGDASSLRNRRARAPEIKTILLDRIEQLTGQARGFWEELREK
ncbi:MAG: hypothetical protein KA354_08645 [Phycisphaerae bacterium]|nr:hypothetical protein [Phycisphaerae bacterium]